MSAEVDPPSNSIQSRTAHRAFHLQFVRLSSHSTGFLFLLSRGDCTLLRYIEAYDRLHRLASIAEFNFLRRPSVGILIQHAYQRWIERQIAQVRAELFPILAIFEQGSRKDTDLTGGFIGRSGTAPWLRWSRQTFLKAMLWHALSVTLTDK
jgi:hypothetical protein